MWCSRCDCFSLNQMSRVRALSMEKSLVGNASFRMGPTLRESEYSRTPIRIQNTGWKKKYILHQFICSSIIIMLKWTCSNYQIHAKRGIIEHFVLTHIYCTWYLLLSLAIHRSEDFFSIFLLIAWRRGNWLSLKSYCLYTNLRKYNMIVFRIQQSQQ